MALDCNSGTHLFTIFICGFIPPTPLHIKKKRIKKIFFLMCKRCFLHMMSSPPPTLPFFCFESQDFCRPGLRSGHLEQGRAPSDRPEGGEPSPGEAGPDFQSAVWLDASLTRVGHRWTPAPPLSPAPPSQSAYHAHSHTPRRSSFQGHRTPNDGWSDRWGVGGGSRRGSALHPSSQKRS